MSDLPRQLRRFGYQETEEAADRIEHLERVLAQARDALKNGNMDMVRVAIADIDEALKS